MQTNNLRRESRSKFLAAIFEKFRVRTNLDAARPPRRQDVVNDKSHARMIVNVTPLPALRQSMTADVNRIRIRVVVESNRHNVWIASFVHGRQSAQTLGSEILQFLLCKNAH